MVLVVSLTRNCLQTGFQKANLAFNEESRLLANHRRNVLSPVSPLTSNHTTNNDATNSKARQGASRRFRPLNYMGWAHTWHSYGFLFYSQLLHAGIQSLSFHTQNFDRSSPTTYFATGFFQNKANMSPLNLIKGWRVRKRMTGPELPFRR